MLFLYRSFRVHVRDKWVCVQRKDFGSVQVFDVRLFNTRDRSVGPSRVALREYWSTMKGIPVPIRGGCLAQVMAAQISDVCLDTYRNRSFAGAFMPKS